MAQSSRAVGYVCRSCRGLLKTNNVRIPQLQQSVRSFSGSPSLLKTLATFTPTSSPELDAVLNSFRNEVFLPSILSPYHQKLVYKTSRGDILTTPPGVSVTIQTALPPSAPSASHPEEETIKLEPMNKFDTINYKEGFRIISQQLSENHDAQTWDNLIPFLEGLRLARVEPMPFFLPRLARIASKREVARWNTILTAARMKKRTGVTLAHRDLTHELVFGTFQRAVEGDFSHPEPPQTMQRIILLLDAPEHCGKTIPQDSKILYADMRRDTTVLAVQTTFAALRVLRELSGSDTEGSAIQCIQRILALEKDNPGCLLASVESVLEQRRRTKAHDIHNAKLTLLTPLYTALALSNKVNMQAVLGKEKSVQTHVEIQKVLKSVRSQVEAAREGLTKSQTSDGGNQGLPRGLLFLQNVEALLQKV